MFLDSIEKINKKNIQHYNLDYILIDNFATEWATAENLKLTKFKRTPIINENQPSSGGHHPINATINHHNDLILQYVNTAFDVNCKSITNAIQLFNRNQHIEPHDDSTEWGGCMEYSKMPIRAILYLNPTKLYGTHLHKKEPGWAKPNDTRWWSHVWDEGIEIGGEPGQLLIIKPNTNSWHSVGLYNTIHDNRITSNWIFHV